MADASTSHMPYVEKKSATSLSQTVGDNSVIPSSSDCSTTARSCQQATDEVKIDSLDPSSSDTDRTGSKEKQQAADVVSEIVDTVDEDHDKSSSSDSSAHNGDNWRELPATPVPWRQGGIWHLRSNSQRDGAHVRDIGYQSHSEHTVAHRRHSAGTSGTGSLRPADIVYHSETDSDSESSVNERMDNLNHAHAIDDEDFDISDYELGVLNWRELLDIDLDHPDNDRDRPHFPPEEPLYPQGLLTETECYVCFEETELRKRLCCDFPVCDSCLESYLMVQVLRANVNIECLNINCNSYIHRSEISARLPPKYKMKFYKFLIDANIDPTVKTCPRCSNGLQVDKAVLKKRKVIKNGLPVMCKRCGLEWCFTCHAPLHKGLTCKEYRKGDILLKDWAREFHYGQLNAQQCPKCKIFIQRSLGCDHMTCSRCDTSFCYRCGENYRGLKLLGNHFSRYSPFGCRYNFLPDAPHLRRLIRGAVLGGKLLGGLVLSGFVVAAGACLLGVSVIALPAWGGYKLHKRRRFQQRMRANRKYAKQNLTLRNLQAKKAAEPSVPSLPVPPLDSSDSMADDSSDEMRDRMMVGLQLPDSQRVEVLVHQTISSSSDQEDGGAVGGVHEVVRETESAVIVTEFKEVVNEDGGYTTVVANVYARPKDKAHTVDSSADATFSSDSSDEEYYTDEGQSHSNSRKSKGCFSSDKRHSTSSKENQTQNGNMKRLSECGDAAPDNKDKTNVSDAKSDSDDQHSVESKCPKTNDGKDKEAALSLEKKADEKETNGSKGKKDKPSENTEKGDKKQTESVPCTEKKEKEKLLESTEKSEKKPEKDKDSSSSCKPADQKDSDQLSKESTNGCFGNIFSKKITVIQIGGRRNTETPADAQKPTNICYKSGTWEKSHDKSSNHKPKTSMDIRDLSHFKEKLPPQSSDASVKAAYYDKGVLLQDFVVLSPPGDFSSQRVPGDGDSLSLASASSAGDVSSAREPEKSGEGGSCCCLSASDSFRDSNLSCDIVTYL